MFKEVIWVHLKSGNHYRIVDFPLREFDLQPMVQYRRADRHGPRFLRTTQEFFDGRYIIVQSDMTGETLTHTDENLNTMEVHLKVDDQMTEKLQSAMVGAAFNTAMDGEEWFLVNVGGDMLRITKDEFVRYAHDFLTEHKGDLEERKTAVRQFCNGYGYGKWSDLPPTHWEEAIKTLRAYTYKQSLQKMETKAAATEAKVAHLETEPTPLKPAPVTDMKGIVINPGEMVEFMGMNNYDRRRWGTEHYRKVMMVEPEDGTVVVEGEGDNRWGGSSLLVKPTLDI